MTGNSINLNQRAAISQVQREPIAVDMRKFLEVWGEFFHGPAEVDRFISYLDCMWIDSSPKTRKVEDFFREYRACLYPRGAPDEQRLLALFNRPVGGGATLLSRAIECGRLAIVRDLLGKSVPRKVPDSEIHNLLSHLKKAGVHTNDADAVRTFLAKRYSELEAVKSLDPKLLNARDDEGKTALIRAVERGDTEVVKLLLDAGADTDRWKEPKHSAMGIAMGRGHADIFQLLLDQGERLSWHGVRSAIQHGKLDILRVLQGHEARFAEGAGFFIGDALVCPPNVRSAVMKLLVAAGADPDWPIEPDNDLPIRVAALDGDALSVRLLLENGADPDASRALGASPLRIALNGQDAEMVTLLMRYRASTTEFSPAELMILQQLTRLDDA
jgi:ankyrin repeat protein